MSGLVACETYHKNAECHKNAEFGMWNAEWIDLPSGCLLPPPDELTLEFRIPHSALVLHSALRISYSRPRPSPYEALQHAPRTHRRQLLRCRPGHPARGARQMAGRRIAEDLHHRSDGVAGVAQQVSGAGGARE